jgi:putative addiction module killer protein
MTSRYPTIMSVRRNNVEIFVSQNGKGPFEAWFQEIKDATEAAEIILAIDDLSRGEFKHCRSIGCGVFEKRIHSESPARLFFALVGSDGLLLLHGSSDGSKKEGAEQALKIWKEFKENAH